MVKNLFVGANFALAFVLELVAVVALALGGFHAGSGVTKWVLGIGLPLLAVAAWALFAAPHSTYDVGWAAVLVKVAVLGGAAVALMLAVGPRWAALYTVVLVVNLVIVHLPGVERHFSEMTAAAH